MASSRAKGYITDFNPRPQTVALLENVAAVLREYRSYLPLTARQVFYRMVGQYGYDKTEQAYARLCEAMVKGRRAGVLDWHAIRDDGTVSHYAGGWDSVAEWWKGELAAAEGYSRDRNEGQDQAIEVWCEAAGMAPQLANACRPYGVPVYSTGGFSSVTVTHEVAKRIVRRDRPTVFMHVGDYDPSGESIFQSMGQDIGAFVAAEVEDFVVSDYGDVEGWFEPTRIALTSEQVRRHKLPTAPPKKSDSRSARWTGETCQAEAMDPGTLTGILTAAIEDLYDMDEFERVKAREQRERTSLVAEVKRNIDARSDDDDDE